MNRDELEHLIRASGAITNQYELVIVGSQSILGSIPYPEPEFKMSAEADIYPLHAPELADQIDGSIGEGSMFHQTNGYYAQGVGPETASCRMAGKTVCTKCRTETPTAVSAGAWTCWTFSCPRRLRPATKTTCFAAPCSSLAMYTCSRPWTVCPACPFRPTTVDVWRLAFGGGRSNGGMGTSEKSTSNAAG
jgi:hypothetical protein